MFARHVFCVLVAVAVAGCGSDDEDDAPLGGSLTVAGDVVDFQTAAGISTGVAVTVSGISPAPMISAQGSTFAIADVPENSVFQILASATNYRPTFSPAIEVTTDDLDRVKAPVVKGSYLDGLAAAFGITPPQQGAS